MTPGFVLAFQLGLPIGLDQEALAVDLHFVDSGGRGGRRFGWAGIPAAVTAATTSTAARLRNIVFPFRAAATGHERSAVTVSEQQTSAKLRDLLLTRIVARIEAAAAIIPRLRRG